MAYLVLHPGLHSREKLCGIFWGDSSENKAHASLRRALTFLRHALPGNLILADREFVQVNQSLLAWVDAFAFEQAARQYLANQIANTNRFDADLYSGDLLEDYYDDWILPLREHFRQLYIHALLRAVENARAHSEYETAMDYARRVIQRDPVNEHACQHLMVCHVLTGDRDGALSVYQTCQRALQIELGVEPSRETRALLDWIQQTRCPSLAARLTNLPIPMSSFVGREQELVYVKQALGHARLVTLTGPGGSGKTRLAIQAATDLIDSYTDGVWWVELAPLSNAALVPDAVAKALGIQTRPGQTPIHALAAFLESRKVLLILDNCEHLLDACAQLTASLLSTCPGLTILDTSREALGLTGEVIWTVPPLLLPEPAHITLAGLLMQYEGIQLFVERASAVRRDFALDEHNANAVVQICQHLDGIPLAIELAATWVKTLPVEEIAHRLNGRLHLLMFENQRLHSRHRTLRATMDWSYDLLSDPERILFRRLSAFWGGWTLETAEAVCSGNGLGSDEIFGLLSRLTDKSLVNLNENRRYVMLETIREYATDKLTESDEAAWLNRQRLEYFHALASTGDKKVRSADQLAWIHRLNAERNNFDNVLQMALEHPDLLEKGCDMVASLAWYWGTIGDFLQAQKWLNAYLLPSTALGDSPARARLLFYAGSLSVWGMNWLDATAALDAVVHSLRIWQGLGEGFKVETGQCLLTQGWIEAAYLGNPAGEALVRQAIEIFQEAGCAWWQAWGMNLLILIQENNGTAPQLIFKQLEELGALWMRIGDYFNAAGSTFDKGTLLMESGRHKEAWHLMQDSLQTFRQFNAKGYIFQVLEKLGDVSRQINQYECAEEYYEECISLAADLNWQHLLNRLFAVQGFVALKRDEKLVAGQYFTRALTSSIQHGRKAGTALGIGGHAALKTLQDEPAMAARLWGAYDAAAAVTKINGVDQQEMESYRSRCQTLLGADVFEREWQFGRSLPLETILAEVMGENLAVAD